MTWSNSLQGFRSVGRAPRLWGAAVAFSVCVSGVTNAQAEVGAESARSGAKATVGGALLGAELVLVAEAIFDVKPWWAYLLGGGLGAAGGAVGGFFVDQQGDPMVSTGFLVGGLVFAIPTTIAVLSATSYEPEANPTIEASDELALSRPVVAPLPPSLVGIDDTGFHLGVPAVVVQEVYSAQTRLTYALPSETEVMVPMVGITF